MKLKYVKMPYELAQILKESIQISALASAGSNKTLNEYLVMTKNEGFKHLLRVNFSEFSPNGSLEYLVRSLGLKGLRNRLASLYIYYLLHKRFPSTSGDPALVSDVVAFEEALEPHSVQGFGRGFLLGLYLKMMNMKAAPTGPSAPLLPPNVMGLLKKTPAREESIDWVVLVLWFLTEEMGEEKLEQALFQKKMSYLEIYEGLSAAAKRELNRNLLVYGQSIFDMGPFAVPHV